MREILRSYYNHVMSNPSTLITRFYGLYSIKSKTNKSKSIRFIIMNNVFDTPFKIDSRYDLKGSTVGREADEKELKRETPILKDLDILKQKKKIIVGAESKKKILAQLKSDTDWLSQNQIMDYSLLLGEHQCEKKEENAIIEDGIQAYSKLLQQNDNFYEENKATELEKVKETLTNNQSSVDLNGLLKQMKDSNILELSPRVKNLGSKTPKPEKEEKIEIKREKIEIKEEKIEIIEIKEEKIEIKEKKDVEKNGKEIKKRR